MSDVGNYVQPKSASHTYYGQTGEIVSEYIPSNGILKYRVDVDGDGASDYIIKAFKTDAGSQLHAGAMFNSMQSVTVHAQNLFDIAVPVILACISVLILSGVVKKIKQR